MIHACILINVYVNRRLHAYTGLELPIKDLEKGSFTLQLPAKTIPPTIVSPANSVAPKAASPVKRMPVTYKEDHCNSTSATQTDAKNDTLAPNSQEISKSVISSRNRQKEENAYIGGKAAAGGSDLAPNSPGVCVSMDLACEIVLELFMKGIQRVQVCMHMYRYVCICVGMYVPMSQF